MILLSHNCCHTTWALQSLAPVDFSSILGNELIHHVPASTSTCIKLLDYLGNELFLIGGMCAAGFDELTMGPREFLMWEVNSFLVKVDNEVRLGFREIEEQRVCCSY